MLDIYKVSLKVARTVGVADKRISVHDKDLARQMRRAMASVTLNIAEGSGCAGGTRRQRYRDALGSANETLAALELAEALGYRVQRCAAALWPHHRSADRLRISAFNTVTASFQPAAHESRAASKLITQRKQMCRIIRPKYAPLRFERSCVLSTAYGPTLCGAEQIQMSRSVGSNVDGAHSVQRG